MKERAFVVETNRRCFTVEAPDVLDDDTVAPALADLEKNGSLWFLGPAERIVRVALPEDPEELWGEYCAEPGYLVGGPPCKGGFFFVPQDS